MPERAASGSAVRPRPPSRPDRSNGPAGRGRARRPASRADSGAADARRGGQRVGNAVEAAGQVSDPGRVQQPEMTLRQAVVAARILDKRGKPESGMGCSWPCAKAPPEARRAAIARRGTTRKRIDTACEPGDKMAELLSAH